MAVPVSRHLHKTPGNFLKAGVSEAGCPAELKAFIKSHEHS